MIDPLAGGGGLIVLFGIILTVLGVGGTAVLRFSIFTFTAAVGIVVIVVGLLITALGIWV
jgi:hypothetical protein